MSKSLQAYLLFAVMSFILQILNLVLLRKSKSQYKKYLFSCSFLCILLIPSYVNLLISKNYLSAMITKSFVFILVDLIVILILNFSQIYIYYLKQTFRTKINLSLFMGLLSDLIMIIINFFHPISFKLVLEESNSGFFWKTQYYIGSYIHYFFVAVIIFSSFLNILIGYIKNPIQYKTRYLGVILAYLLVAFANAFSYAIKIDYNISIITIGFFIEFIYYYSTFIIPHHLLIQSLKSINSTVDDAIIYFDKNGKIVYINNSAKDIFIENEVFNYEQLEEFRRRKLEEHKSELDKVKLTWNENFVIFGESRHMYFEYEDVTYDNANLGSYFLITDKTDEINKLEKEKYANTHDSLTEIFNEQSFYDSADKLILNDPDTPRYMITTNIRDFKLINELFGQDFGNKVLIKEAEIIKKAFKGKNTVYGRLNDDKFAILIEKIHFHEQMFVSFTEQIKSLFDNSYTQIHFNVGICEVYKDDPAKTLVGKTKIAIEMGKHENNETFFYYDSLVMEKILEEKNIVSEFKNAILYNQIKIELQSIVDGNGNIKGVEALSRWYNPNRGLLYPGKFIPILEKNSIIHNLDIFLWETVAKKIAQWQENGKETPFISVNISDKDVYYIDLYNVFTRIALENHIPPEKLVLEFKESAIVSNVDRISKLFVNLREFGFKIAIDNYGTGYSSLNFLKDVQVDIVKIDMVFLSENEDFERSKLILNFISQLTRELNIELVFEGVETLDQYKLIKKFGNVYMQGYYFSNSISLEQFEAKLKQEK